jgi:hypothetical protein
MKIKVARHARVFIVTCALLVDSASLAFGSPVGSELKEGRLVVVGEPTINSYPQAVDNSNHYRINKSKSLWITHAEQIVTLTWGIKEIKPFKTIIYKESRWNPNATNPTTGAYGLGQLINSKRYLKDMPYKQINATVKYIFNRYGTPTKALAHHLKHGWY